MDLTSLLEQQRKTILGRWFDKIVATYPSGSAEFLAKQKDRFRNPVGHTTRTSIEAVYDEIVGSMDIDRLRLAVDGIVRVRAVQDFTAAQAVEFVFLLKPVVRDVVRERLGDEMHLATSADKTADLDARIDQVAMIAFDKYMECRDKLHEVRTKEIQNRSMRLIDRLGTNPCGSGCKGEPANDDN